MRKRIFGVSIILSCLLLVACQSGDQVSVQKEGLSSDDALMLMKTTNSPEQREQVLNKIESFRAPGFDWDQFWLGAKSLTLVETEAIRLAALGQHSCQSGFSHYSEAIANMGFATDVLAQYALTLKTCELSVPDAIALKLARSTKDHEDTSALIELGRVLGTLEMASEELHAFLQNEFWGSEPLLRQDKFLSQLMAIEPLEQTELRGLEVLWFAQDELKIKFAMKNYEKFGQFFQWTSMVRSKTQLLSTWPWLAFFDGLDRETLSPKSLDEVEAIFVYVCGAAAEKGAEILIAKQRFSSLLSLNRTCHFASSYYGLENLQAIVHSIFTGLSSEIPILLQVLFEQILTIGHDKQSLSELFRAEDEAQWISVLNFLRGSQDRVSLQHLFATFQNLLGAHPYLEADLVAMSESSVEFNTDYEKFGYLAFENQNINSDRLARALANSPQITAEGFEALLKKASPVCAEPTRTNLLTRALAVAAPATTTLPWVKACATDLPLGLAKSFFLDAIKQLPPEQVELLVDTFSQLQRSNQNWYWRQLEKAFTPEEWLAVGEFASQDLAQFAQLVSLFGAATGDLLTNSLDFTELLNSEALETLTRQVGRPQVLSLMESLWRVLPKDLRLDEHIVVYSGIMLSLFEEDVKNSEPRLELIQQAVGLLKNLEKLILARRAEATNQFVSEHYLDWLGRVELKLSAIFAHWPQHDMLEVLTDTSTIEALWLAFSRASLDARLVTEQDLVEWNSRLDRSQVSQSSVMSELIRQRLELAIQSLQWQLKRDIDSAASYHELQGQFCRTLEIQGIATTVTAGPDFDLRSTENSGCFILQTKSELINEEIHQETLSFALETPLQSHPNSVLQAPGASLEVTGASWTPSFIDLSTNSSPENWISLPILLGVYVEKGQPELLISAGLHHFVFNLMLRKEGDHIEAVSYPVFGYFGGDLRVESSAKRQLSFVSSGQLSREQEPSFQQSALLFDGESYGISSRMNAWINTWREGEFWTPGLTLELPTENLRHHFKAQPHSAYIQFILERARKGVSGEPLLFFNPSGIQLYLSQADQDIFSQVCKGEDLETCLEKQITPALHYQFSEIGLPDYTPNDSEVQRFWVIEDQQFELSPPSIRSGRSGSYFLSTQESR